VNRTAGVSRSAQRCSIQKGLVPTAPPKPWRKEMLMVSQSGEITPLPKANQPYPSSAS